MATLIINNMNYYIGNITPGKDIVLCLAVTPKAGTLPDRQKLPFKSLGQSMERAMGLREVRMR